MTGKLPHKRLVVEEVGTSMLNGDGVLQHRCAHYRLILLQILRCPSQGIWITRDCEKAQVSVCSQLICGKIEGSATLRDCFHHGPAITTSYRDEPQGAPRLPHCCHDDLCVGLQLSACPSNLLPVLLHSVEYKGAVTGSVLWCGVALEVILLQLRPAHKRQGRCTTAPPLYWMQPPSTQYGAPWVGKPSVVHSLDGSLSSSSCWANLPLPGARRKSCRWPRVAASWKYG
mmetsp:Transcript_51575/g.122691  ORF Transcript_51575/g.122691 Transcript_51575/m.122691 type:complete len:229 (+) Transcript_51575:269-955(+)